MESELKLKKQLLEAFKELWPIDTKGIKLFCIAVEKDGGAWVSEPFGSIGGGTKKQKLVIDAFLCLVDFLGRHDLGDYTDV